MRNVSICGAAETLLIDKMCLKTHCKPILDQLSTLGCKIVGDKIIRKFISGKMKIATKKDWETEYLSPIISVKSVNGVTEAIDHINQYSSSHTESIVTKNRKTAKKFLSNGDKVKFTIRFKGRELQHSNLGHDLMSKIKEDIKLVGKVEMNPKFDGKQMITVIQPV